MLDFLPELKQFVSFFNIHFYVSLETRFNLLTRVKPYLFVVVPKDNHRPRRPAQATIYKASSDLDYFGVKTSRQTQQAIQDRPLFRRFYLTPEHSAGHHCQTRRRIIRTFPRNYQSARPALQHSQGHSENCLQAIRIQKDSRTTLALKCADCQEFQAGTFPQDNV